MSRNRNLILVPSLLAIAALVGPGVAEAKKKKYEKVSQYAVEFTCGRNSSDFQRVLPGDYSAVVNVHNAGDDTRVRARVSLSFPGSQESDWVQTGFERGQTRQFNCKNIFDQFVFAQPIDDNNYIQGYLVIQTRGEIDVTARYTTSGPEGSVSSDVEVAEARTISRKKIPHDSEVEICHVPPGNPGNAHTIWVDPSSVSAHLNNHDDYLGSCDD